MQTGRIHSSARLCVVAAAATLAISSGALAQGSRGDRVASPAPPLRNAPSTIILAQTGGDEGGLAGDNLYINNTETGFRSQPAETTPLPTAFMDDIPVPTSRLNGATRIQVRRVTVGLRRSGTASAPPSVATDVRFYWANVIANPTPPTGLAPMTIQTPTLINPTPVSLPVSAVGGFITELVSFGDGVTPLFSVDLNMDILPGFGTFSMGASMSGNAVNSPNGMRLTSGPDANTVNIIWTYNPNTNAIANTWFGAVPAAPASTFMWVVEGVPDTCSMPLASQTCPTDVDGNNNTDVDDLISVILGWGQTGPPRPGADVAPLPNGNCTVDVDDLIAVILAWGQCPDVSGACCLPNGSCSEILQGACDTAGGLFHGPFTTCAGVICPPTNDNCSGAFGITPGVFPAAPTSTNGSNAGATDGSVPVPSCLPALTRDVWYSYTVPSDADPDYTGQTLTLDLCDTTGNVTNSAIAVYRGTCGALDEVACNNDGCLLQGSVETTVLLEGETIFIRVGTMPGATNEGDFVLNALVRNVTTDACNGAQEVAIGGSVTRELVDATSDFASTCQGVDAGVGRWHTVVGDGTVLTASTCSSNSDIHDGRISVFCAGDFGCAALNCVAATDADQGLSQPPECPAFQGESVSWCSAENQRYWIYIHAPNIPQGATGSYTLTVTGGATCTATVDCSLGSPPANDECANAATAVVGNNPLDNRIATTSTGLPATMCGQPWSKDVWFVYTSANGGAVNVSITSNPIWDSVIEVYTATSTCAALTVLACEDDDAGCVACHGNFSFTATAGSTYIIRVASWSTSAGGTGNLVIADP